MSVIQYGSHCAGDQTQPAGCQLDQQIVRAFARHARAVEHHHSEGQKTPDAENDQGSSQFQFKTEDGLIELVSL